jgi:hypothetical protein
MRRCVMPATKLEFSVVDLSALEPARAQRASRSALFVASALTLTALCATSAQAAPSPSRLEEIERQLIELKAQLHALKERNAAREHQLKAVQAQPATPKPTQIAPLMPQIPAGYALVPATPGSTPGSVVLAKAQAPAKPTLPMGVFQIGPVSIKLGGFFAEEGAYRARNQAEDIQSNLNTGIPERISPLYHEPEFLESARQTRITSLMTANPDESTKIQGYLSVDFSGGAPTSNANESNGWVPRLREGYLAYSDTDWNYEILAGQAFSLLTMTRVGMEPLNVNPPPTIDPSYVAGFDWARQAQLRIEKSFLDKEYWLALSVENPQSTFTQTSIPSAVGTLNYANAGIGVDATGGSFSNNLAPDVIVKAVADYPIAHLEAFGLGSVFNDRISRLGTGQSNTTFGGGGGGAALIRVIPNVLELNINGMVGKGIGRYGTSQLPEATVGSRGQPVPLPEWDALAGIVGHPTPMIDLYGYVGTEQISARYFDNTVKGKTTAYGYGNPLYSNAGCDTELSTLTCTANTSGIVMGAVGAWYRFLKGPYGTLQAGIQYSYVHRSVFGGIGPTPETDDNMLFLSFRYFPFQ